MIEYLATVGMLILLMWVAVRSDEIMTNEKYEIEIICQGGFYDGGYLIRIVTFRVNPRALKDWDDCKISKSSAEYTRYSDYIDDCQERGQKRSAWMREIRDLAGCQEGENCYITQDNSEIFTAVFIKKIESTRSEEP